MPDNSSSNKRIAKNSIFLTIRMVIVLGISLYTTRVVLRVLGVEDYGVYNVVCGFVSMFGFLNTSMSNGIQRFFNFEFGKNGEEGANKVFCTAVLIQTILALIIIILVESFGLWYLHNKIVIPAERMGAAEWIFQFAIISFLFTIMQAPFTAAVMAHERMDFFAIISLLDAFLKLGFVLLLPYLKGDQLIIYGLLLVTTHIINFFLYYFYCKKNFKEIVFHRHFDRDLFRSMLGFSGWNLFGSFSGVMKEHGINLVINFFFGPVVNAARGVAAQVNGGIQGFVGNILTPVRPQVVQSYARGDINRSLNLTFSISKLSSCFFLMMAIPASLEIDYVLSMWLGDNVPAHSAAFTILVLCTSIFEILNGATSTVVHASGIMKQYQLSGGIIGICSVPIAFFLLKLYQVPEIALLAVLLCSSIRHIIGLFIVRKIVGMSVRTYTRKVFVPLFSVCFLTLLFLFPIRFFMPASFLRLIIITILCIVLIIAFLYWFGLEKQEQQLIKELFEKVRNKVLKI